MSRETTLARSCRALCWRIGTGTVRLLTWHNVFGNGAAAAAAPVRVLVMERCLQDHRCGFHGVMTTSQKLIESHNYDGCGCWNYDAGA
jgi:hypothetical protein